MKENIGTKQENFCFTDIISAVVQQLIIGVFGFLGSRASVMGQFAPFGIAFAAGMPKKYIAAAGVGAALGYFIPAVEGSGFRYFAAVFAVCTIRLLLGGIGKLDKKAFLSAATAFAASLATALATIAGGDFSPAFAAIESVLAAAGAYFINRTAVIGKRERAGLNAEQLACTIMSANIILMGLYPLTLNGISLGRILAALCILMVARYSRAAGGAVAGCVVSVFVMLGGTQYHSAALIFAVGGLLCGIFSLLGKIVEAVIFTVWASVGALFFSQTGPSYIILCEATFASALFILMPSTLSVKFGKFFSPPANIPSLDGLKRALTMRLFFASEALEDVCETVREVSNELSLINAPDFDWVIGNVHDDACRGCSLCSYCWQRKQKETRDAILYMTKLIKGGEEHPDSGAPDEWRERCLRPSRVGNATHRFYSEYAAKVAAETRIEEIRGVVSDQFDGISSMLFDLATEFEKSETFDTSMAAAVSDALKDIDIRVSDCACRTDKYGRISIEMRLCLPQTAIINRMDILRIVEGVVGRDFEPPTVNRTKGEAFIMLCEKANLTVQVGVAQLNCKDGAVCGDAYTTFNDGKGRSILLLSDGMGTGGRAAVDGAMTCGLMERLLKAGFGYDCALSIVNSCLLFKSTDESLATVDVACIDLFTGKTDLLKVGAAPTVIRRNGRTGKAQSTSLPVGILRDVGFDRASVNLRAGDVLLLMSDGATQEGTDWICAELEAFRNTSAQHFAERLATAARKRRRDGHDDDITVIVALLEKAV